METKTLIKSEAPFPLLRQFGRDLDLLFNRFGLGPLKVFEATPGVFTPEVEVLERGGEFIVRVDVPGLKKEDITLEITDQDLVIRGERQLQKEDKAEGFYRSEFSYGEFARTVPLPEGVTAEKAKAVIHNGMLEVKMPIVKIAPKLRRLEIQESATGEKSAKHAA